MYIHQQRFDAAFIASLLRNDPLYEFDRVARWACLQLLKKLEIPAAAVPIILGSKRATGGYG